MLTELGTNGTRNSCCGSRHQNRPRQTGKQKPNELKNARNKKKKRRRKEKKKKQGRRKKKREMQKQEMKKRGNGTSRVHCIQWLS